MKKTEKIFDENNNLVGEFDYPDLLVFLIKIINEEVKGVYYFENEHGGRNKIDEFGCSYYKHNPNISRLLNTLVRAQIKKKNQKI